MNLNCEFVEDVGLNKFAETFSRRVFKNNQMLKIKVDLNRNFLKQAGTEVLRGDRVVDLMELNVIDLTEWFEGQIRQWIAETQS